MSKAPRPSVFGDLSIEPEAADQMKSLAHAAKAVAEPAGEESAFMRTSIYLNRMVHDRLREIAFHERKKVNDLVMEGLDRVFAERGYGPATAGRAKRA